MIDKLTVKQSKGKDSIIEVHETTIKSWPDDKHAFVFITDQSLSSQSDRAWNVHRAIKDYADSRGYQHNNRFDEKNKLTYIYDHNYHSKMIEFRIREQVKNDERYKSASGDAIQEMKHINQEYGSIINELKRIARQLEEENRAKLQQIKDNLIETQVSIISKIGIPKQVTEHDKKFMLKPKYPYITIEIDHYKSYSKPTKEELLEAIEKFF
jgi:hypothetical protein